jgi:hypothetical protein
MHGADTIRGVCLTLGSVGLIGCSDSVGLARTTGASEPRVDATLDKWSWSEPQSLGPVVNAEGFDNRNAMISTNGKSLYFGSDRPGGSGALDLYVSHRANPHEAWEAPINLGSTINSSAVDNNPYLTDDELEIFFSGTRSGSCGSVDLWTSHRADAHDDHGWSTPANLGCTINSTGSDSGPVYFVDPATGTTMLFFASMRPGGQGNNDFWVSTRGSDGTWGAAVIIPELNSPFDDNKLAIERDGLTVYFSSNRPGGGQDLVGFNIWVATRATTQDAWSTPTIAVESAGLPAISTNGKSLYMVRRGVGGGPFKNALFVSTRERAP